MEDQKKKPDVSNEALLKEEEERRAKIEEAKKEIGRIDKPAKAKKTEIDEQDSDGSANAFRDK